MEGLLSTGPTPSSYHDNDDNYEDDNDDNIAIHYDQNIDHYDDNEDDDNYELLKALWSFGKCAQASL